MSTTEAFDKFQKTIELLSRNKVTKANAFENRLLNIESKLIDINSNETSEDRWRYYSTVVDACGKVYGFCVDHIHEETYKILGGVARTYDTETTQDDKPQLQSRRQPLHGTRTIETNESAINLKEWDRSEKYDPDFTSMKKTFDSNKSSTMLLNTLSLNSNLDLICSPEDKIIGHDSYPVPILSRFHSSLTESDLFLLELCPSLHNFLQKFTQKPSNFEEVWSKVNQDFEERSVQESVDSEPERRRKKEEIPVSHFEINLEDRIIEGNMPSDEVVFSRDFLESNITKKPKKRKQKETLKDSNFNYPLTIMKLELDHEGENLLPKEAKLRVVPEKNDNVVEVGYKERRLAELFTRHGKFYRVSFGEQLNPVEEYSDLPNFNESLVEGQPESIKDSKMDLDIRLVKEKVSSLLKEKKLKDFSSILNTLPSKLDSRTLENLSVHSCFVTLLHLANEQNLIFEKAGDCNFSIKKYH